MGIENTLERIADALEAIANSKALPITGSSETKATKVGSAGLAEIAGGTAATKTRPGKKTETQKVEEEVEAAAFEASEEGFEEAAVDDTPLKWADVNKELLAHCTAVSEAKGRPAGQEVYSTFKTKYANGEKLTEATVKPGLYRALLAEVRELAAEFEAANG